MNAGTDATDVPAGVAVETFRNVVGHLASGVTVITTRRPDGPHGMTASSVTSLSMNPPMMVVCLHNSAPTTMAVIDAQTFAINVLGQDSGHLAAQFATPSEDKFADVALTQSPLGLPLLTEALAHLECEVTDQVVGGTHTIFLGRVLHAEARVGEPLTYFRGGFGRFEFARDDEVYQQARAMVLDRQLAVNSVVTVDDLSARLDVGKHAAFYALTRLAGDGLIAREPARGYVVVPFDTRSSDEAFDARCAIELGVVHLTVPTISSFQLDELRSRFDLMARMMRDDRFVDFDRYLDANHAFHEAVVRLAGNPSLTAAFGRLSLRSVMARSFGATPVTSQQFVEAQRAILSGYEAGDVTATATAVLDYTAIAKQRAREVLAQAGGRM